MAVLVSSANAEYAEATINETEVAARSMGLQIQVLKASTIREINADFATFVNARPDALFVGHEPFFNSRRTQLVQLAARYALPASFNAREFAEAGGLMSYGANIADAWRQAGAYAGSILKGAKPADLPVVQSNKFELVINNQTATMLNLIVPPSLLAIADEVIEWRREYHSAFIFANWITSAHFLVSSAMSLLKSPGDSANGVLPKSARCAFIFGSASPALISLLSVLMISTGVFFGAAMPLQPSAS